MSYFEVQLETEDITVIGGPSVVNVQTDFGPAGPRGSFIFVGNGNPNEISIGQIPQIFDLFINLSSTSPEFLFIYQYQLADGQPTWVKLTKLSPNTYNRNRLATFSSIGQASIPIPVIDIVQLSDFPLTLSPDNFNIQYTIIGPNPVSSSIQLQVTGSVGEQLLTINLKAVEFVNNSWQPLTGNKTVQLFATVL